MLYNVGGVVVEFVHCISNYNVRETTRSCNSSQSGKTASYFVPLWVSPLHCRPVVEQSVESAGHEVLVAAIEAKLGVKRGNTTWKGLKQGLRGCRVSVK